MPIRSFRDADVRGKRVLVRVDFNVPLDGSEIRDDTRVQAALPTIRALRDAGARIILASHLGRPKGKVDPKYSIGPVGKHLSSLLGVQIPVAADVVGDSARGRASGLEPGQVMLLENLRFEPGEEKNDSQFVSKLADLADIYVNDAFGAAHRAHASTTGVAGKLPSYAGDLMLREIEALRKLVDRPRGGFVAIIGGAKVSDKIRVLERLVERVETLIIGGGMANTFLFEAGLEVGVSLTEPDAVSASTAIRQEAKRHKTRLLLPVDAIVATSIDSSATHSVPVTRVLADSGIYDIGPETTEIFSKAIEAARTIFWNGPMGVFEHDQFAKGTIAVAHAVAESDAYSVVGGGDSVASIKQAGIADQVSHVSTGGGASLEFIEGRELPGIIALEQQS